MLLPYWSLNENFNQQKLELSIFRNLILLQKLEPQVSKVKVNAQNLWHFRSSN